MKNRKQELRTIATPDKWDEIRPKILGIINPTEDENKSIKDIVEQTSKIISDWNGGHEKNPIKFIEAHGSTGIKQTHLKNSADIDLFIFLEPEKYRNFITSKNDRKNREKLNILFYELCNNWLIPSLEAGGYSEVILSYAEHPYVSALYKQYDIDVVFAFLLTEEELLKNGPITAVDRTYYHSKFIREHLTERQREDVRILKKFFKIHFSYGDKAPIGRGGFIGYAIELLIFHFGDIFSVFENFANLHNIPIDFYKRSENELRQSDRLNKDLILIMDPTDKKRNVASSISPRSWIFCSKVIQKFMDDPNVDIFLKEIPIKIDKDAEEFNENYVIVEFEHVLESHYTKIRDKLYSVADSIQNLASHENDRSIRFPDVEYSIFFNPSNKIYAIAYYTGKMTTNSSYLRKGPKAEKNSSHYIKFIEKHKNSSVIKNGYCWVDQKRKYTNFLTLVQNETKKRIFDELKLLNVSIPRYSKTNEALKALFVLQSCILPFSNQLHDVLRSKIKPRQKKTRD